mmetsp:Transcript_10983/g.15824  ORF Transcript_10983/g.15824 Transcript_10983/m.15824 type:complete len:242 (+) Transcript_10983:263-988(+)
MKYYGRTSDSEYFLLTEQKRLQRLSKVKSSISHTAKHDGWTRKQVEKRATEILHQKHLSRCEKLANTEREGIKVKTGNGATFKSELTKCGLRLRLCLDENPGQCEADHALPNDTSALNNKTIRKRRSSDSKNEFSKDREMSRISSIQQHFNTRSLRDAQKTTQFFHNNDDDRQTSKNKPGVDDISRLPETHMILQRELTEEVYNKPRSPPLSISNEPLDHIDAKPMNIKMSIKYFPKETVF